MPHSQYYGSNGQNMGNQGAGSMSIAMRMKANRDALLPKPDNQSEYGAYMQNKEYARQHNGPQSAKLSYQQSPSKYAEMISPGLAQNAQEQPSNRMALANKPSSGKVVGQGLNAQLRESRQKDRQ